MLIDIDFAELHTALFLNGTNLQMKLYTEGARKDNKGTTIHGRAGLTLRYDRAEKELLVTFNGVTAIIPSSNVASMTLPSKITAPILTHSQVAEKISNQIEAQKQSVVAAEATVSRIGKLKQASAQVGNPASHVHADGPGKVRD
jgi:hypothetical protein